MFDKLRDENNGALNEGDDYYNSLYIAGVPALESLCGYSAGIEIIIVHNNV